MSHEIMLDKSNNNVKQFLQILPYHVRMGLQGRINELITDKGVKPAEFARQIKSSRAAVSDWLKGNVTEISYEKAKNIAAYCDVNFEWVMHGKGEKHTKTTSGKSQAITSNASLIGGFDLWDNDTPLRDDEVALPFFREVKLSAGTGLTSEVQENHGTKLRFAKSTLKRKGVQEDHAACCVVSGNSMEPVLPDGSTVGIDTLKTEVINGKIYAIDHNGELRVKLVYSMPGGGLRLRSYNIDEYPDEPYPDASCLRILGQVFWYSVLL